MGHLKNCSPGFIRWGQTTCCNRQASLNLKPNFTDSVPSDGIGWQELYQALYASRFCSSLLMVSYLSVIIWVMATAVHAWRARTQPEPDDGCDYQSTTLSLSHPTLVIFAVYGCRDSLAVTLGRRYFHLSISRSYCPQYA